MKPGRSEFLKSSLNLNLFHGIQESGVTGILGGKEYQSAGSRSRILCRVGWLENVKRSSSLGENVGIEKGAKMEGAFFF